MVAKNVKSLASSFELVLSSKSKGYRRNPKVSCQIFEASQNFTTGPIKPLVNGYSPLTTKSSAS